MPTNLENEALETLTKIGGEARRVVPHTATDRYGRFLVNASSAPSVPIVGTAATVEVTAGATSSEALAANTSRLAASIFNKSLTETAYIAIGEAATTSKIPIRPGEWWHMYHHGCVFTQQINCIRGGGSDVTLVVVSG